MASRDDKPLMASVTIDVDFSRLPHLVRALMVEEGHKLDELASRFKSDVVESLALNNGDGTKLNTPLAMRRIDEFRKSLESLDSQLQQQHNLLLAHYRKENGELLKDKNPEQPVEEDKSQPVTEEEFKEQLATADKFNAFVQQMEETEEEDNDS